MQKAESAGYRKMGWGPCGFILPLVCALLILVALGGGQNADAPAAQTQTVTMYTYKVIKSYPHDQTAFTQGLAYEKGVVYEGTGLRGQSVFLKRRLEDGKLIKRERLPRKYFGEGITLFGEKAIQLTWKSRTGFVYDKETFRVLDEFKYTDQGWGITYDGKRFIMSDGTPTLRILDPNTFAVTGRIQVKHKDRNVRGLNELEFIDGKIYANIWPTEYIAIIAPKTGEVTGWLNLTGLCPVPEPRPSNIVLNGIAYMPETKHLLVTGKCWPKLFEIEMVPLTSEQQ